MASEKRKSCREFIGEMKKKSLRKREKEKKEILLKQIDKNLVSIIKKINPRALV